MKVEHKAPQNDPTLGSFDCHAICYRTEVNNTNSAPIQVVWFQFFIEHDGQWTIGWKADVQAKYLGD